MAELEPGKPFEFEISDGKSFVGYGPGTYVLFCPKYFKSVPQASRADGTFDGSKLTWYLDEARFFKYPLPEETKDWIREDDPQRLEYSISANLRPDGTFIGTQSIKRTRPASADASIEDNPLIEVSEASFSARKISDEHKF